jgi:hypothetical protein
MNNQIKARYHYHCTDNNINCDLCDLWALRMTCHEKFSAPCSARRSRSSSMNNSTVEVARGNDILYYCHSISEYQCAQRTENSSRLYWKIKLKAATVTIDLRKGSFTKLHHPKLPIFPLSFNRESYEWIILWISILCMEDTFHQIPCSRSAQHSLGGNTPGNWLL